MCNPAKIITSFITAAILLVLTYYCYVHKEEIAAAIQSILGKVKQAINGIREQQPGKTG